MTSTVHRASATAGRTIDVSAPPRSAWEARVVVITVLVVGLALSGVVLLALKSKLPATADITTVNTVPTAQYPATAGIPDRHEPSGFAPPGPAALPGYHRVYVTDFNSRVLGAVWQVFTGKPGGVPPSIGQFAASHVIVGGGLLRLVTTHDPAFPGIAWTGGGLCQCGKPLLYGAFFVRSRITGPGPNEVELLWPQSNRWPPEVDFNETGDRDNSTSWTQHYGADNNRIQGIYRVDMTQWHTWGVIWSPTSLTFTVDGHVWGHVGASDGIPSQAMTLDLEQRPACLGPTDCVSAAETMDVDWIAEYQAG